MRSLPGYAFATPPMAHNFSMEEAVWVPRGAPFPPLPTDNYYIWVPVDVDYDDPHLRTACPSEARDRRNQLQGNQPGPAAGTTQELQTFIDLLAFARANTDRETFNQWLRRLVA